MKWIALIIYFTFLYSCTTTYMYDVKLKQPVISDTLMYQNDTMKIRFSFEETSLKILIENKTNQGIKINWDEASMSVNGKSYRVVHKETGLYKMNDLQPPTVVAPMSYMEDNLIPGENAYVSSKSIAVAFAKLFPMKAYSDKKSKEKVLSMRGKTVYVSMPFYINNIYMPKTFEIFIKDVLPKKIKPGKYADM